MGEFIRGVILAAILLLVAVAYLDAFPRSEKPPKQGEQPPESGDSESGTTQLSGNTDEELKDE